MALYTITRERYEKVIRLYFLWKELNEGIKEDFTRGINLPEAMTNKDTVYQLRRVYVRENKKGVSLTLTANMGTGGHNVPLVIDDFGIRKLTPKECFELQGFPKTYKLPEKMANSHLYKQAGNSVTVTVIEKIAERMLEAMK
ncbi:MAG: DNA cytosine methyltransferase [Clostridium sp.]|nr:DNA cytosine methyltransferase [Clostridium sp.]